MMRIFRYGWVVALSLVAFSGWAQVVQPSVADLPLNDRPQYPELNLTGMTPAQQALVQKGEYLAKAGDCMACHTDAKHGGKAFAGGLGIATPVGTFYTPNITPDKETGIGGWTNAQFIRAMQDGISAKGHNYFPVFPYMYFTRVNNQDLIAIKAYLDAIPAVHHQNYKDEGYPILDWRFLQWGFKLMSFQWHKGVFQPDPTQSAQWNRGAYLVQGLGHCAMCHSPLPYSVLANPKSDKLLTGGFVNGFYAPDITSRGLHGISVDDIVKVFQQGQMLRGAGQVQGPMAEVNYDSLRYLSKEDLEDIAIYLKAVPNKTPLNTKVAKIGPNTGRDIYEDHCAVCHGTGAAGAPKLGDVPDWQPRIAEGMDVLFSHALNGFNSMPPKGTCMSCSDDQVKAAVEYLVSNSKSGSKGFSAPKSTVNTQPPLTMMDGQKVYQAHCSVCHDSGKFGAPKVGDMAAWKPIINKNINILFKFAIDGHKKLSLQNNCPGCSNAEVIAATKYMVQNSQQGGNYSLW